MLRWRQEKKRERNRQFPGKGTGEGMALEPRQARTQLTGQTAAHYRIMEMIGHGGMGEVYRAHDDHLDRSVAIKALPPRLAGDDIARRRFIRETRVASQVIHPYVATVFDVVDHHGNLLLVMELIEGEKLSSIIHQTPPDPQRAVTYATEISEALNAIHAVGLTHRDLKPGNVMITREGHVKVMDFGLARQATPVDISGSDETARASDATITREGTGVGTVLYMSPEQLRGERADARSDLFAFGILLYELITGSHPFVRPSVHESVAAILREAPGGESEPATLSQSGPLRNVVMRLLEKEPDRRYQDSGELIRDLRAVSEGAVRLPREQARLRRRLTVGIPSVLLAAGALAFAGYWWVTSPPVWEQPRFSIAVTPFADHTGDDDGGLRGVMVADLLASDMAASRLVRVLGPSEIRPMLNRLGPEATPDEIADVVSRGALVDYVLVGNLYREGDQYVATSELIAASENATDLPTLQAAGISALTLADHLGSDLRRALPGVSAMTAWRDDRTDLVEITSGSEEARRLYARGLLAKQDGNYQEAIDWFEKAIETDPGFAMAQAMHAAALRAVGYDRRARESASKAVALVEDPRSPAERRLALHIRAIRAEAFSRLDEAVEITEQLIELYPDEPGVLNLHANMLYRAGEYDRALEVLGRSMKLDPLGAATWLIRGKVLLQARRYPEARDAFAEAGRLFDLVGGVEGRASTEYWLGQLLTVEERYDEARTQLNSAFEALVAAGDKVMAAEALQKLADIELLTGNAAAAAEMLARTEEVARETGNLHLLDTTLTRQAIQLHQTGDLEGAERLYREAVDLARQLEDDHLLVNPLSNLAVLLGNQGRNDEAREILQESIELARRLDKRQAALVAQFLLADIRYQEGDVDGAAELYEQALEGEEYDGSRRMKIWIHLGLAEVQSSRGRLALALEQSDHATRIAGEMGVPLNEGYALARRARVLADLGRKAESWEALERVQAIIRNPQSGLTDLEVRVAMTNSMLEARRGAWSAALGHAERATAMTGAQLPGLQAAALILVCEDLIGVGRHEEAIPRCREAMEIPRVPRTQIVDAGALLAEALASAGELEQAREQALDALDDAGRMGLMVPTLRAAAVLLALPHGARPDNEPSIRNQAREALTTYVASAPEADRAAVRARDDVRAWARVIEGEEIGAGNPSEAGASVPARKRGG